MAPFSLHSTSERMSCRGVASLSPSPDAKVASCDRSPPPWLLQIRHAAEGDVTEAAKDVGDMAKNAAKVGAALAPPAFQPPTGCSLPLAPLHEMHALDAALPWNPALKPCPAPMPRPAPPPHRRVCRAQRSLPS